MAPIGTLTDDFPGSSLSGLWTVTLAASGSVTVASNLCSLPIGTGYESVGSLSTYDCTNGILLGKATAAGAVLSTLEMGYNLSTSQVGLSGTSNGFQFGTVGGNLTAVWRTGTTNTFPRNNLAYSPAGRWTGCASGWVERPSIMATDQTERTGRTTPLRRFPPLRSRPCIPASSVATTRLRRPQTRTSRQ
jgi:hypothetical protein